MTPIYVYLGALRRNFYLGVQIFKEAPLFSPDLIRDRQHSIASLGAAPLVPDSPSRHRSVSASAVLPAVNWRNDNSSQMIGGLTRGVEADLPLPPAPTSLIQRRNSESSLSIDPRHCESGGFTEVAALPYLDSSEVPMTPPHINSKHRGTAHHQVEGHHCETDTNQNAYDYQYDENTYAAPLETFEFLNIMWNSYSTEAGDIYYLDSATSHSQWEDPRVLGIIKWEESAMYLEGKVQSPSTATARTPPPVTPSPRAADNYGARETFDFADASLGGGAGWAATAAAGAATLKPTKINWDAAEGGDGDDDDLDDLQAYMGRYGAPVVQTVIANS
jgi:hypothetical protein